MLPFWKSENGEEEKSGNIKRWLILAGAALGIALLLWGGNVTQEGTQTESAVYDPAEDELVLYQKYLEEQVRELCESVTGVSGVTAVVTLSGGFESVYATEISGDDEQYVIVGSGSSASALFLSRSAPTIAGIGIVCKGGSDATLRQELIRLLSATYHVSTNRIYITE
jgi:hypothetical protein